VPISRTVLAALAAVLLIVVASSPATAFRRQTTIDNFGNSQDPTTSTVTSPDGGVYVAWARTGSDELYWSRRTPDGWSHDTVTGEGTFVQCYDNSIFAEIGPAAAFAPDGEPRIASACLAVGGGAKILYSSRENGVWTTGRVGYGPSRDGFDSSATTLALTMSPTGRPWQQLVEGFVVCCGSPQYKMLDAATDPVTGLLAVAWTNRFIDGSALFFAEFNARGTIVGSVEEISFGDLGAFGRPSLAFLPNGDPAIAVQQGDGTLGSAAIAVRTGGTWATHTIDDSSSNMGLDPALDITGDVFRAAYPDDVAGDLRYAESTDGVAWNATTAASLGNVGDVPSLAVSPTGRVTIAYYDSGRTALRSVVGP
jgi:hypothetical protein